MAYSRDPVEESECLRVEETVMPRIFKEHCGGPDDGSTASYMCNWMRSCLFASLTGDCFPYWQQQIRPAVKGLAREVGYRGDAERESVETLNVMNALARATTQGDSER